MIAYLILVHRYPNQFKRLFKAIYHPSNYYAIHIDKRSAKQIHVEIEKFLSDYPNTKIIKSEKALWGGYSLVNIELRGISELLKMGNTWTSYINLSAQDFPLKNQIQIKKFLDLNKGKEFIKLADQKLNRAKTMGRLYNYVFEFNGKVRKTPFKRLFMSGITPYIGNQWMILTREFCEFIDKSSEIDKFKKFYKNSFIADEGFFQTVLMNSSFKSNIINDDKREIDWVPMGTIKMRPRYFVASDYKFLSKSKNLFARKFSEIVDSKIFTSLERNLN